MNNKKNRKGFTIVELVIVIAVIAILATVLVPTFGNVIEKANTSAAIQEAKTTYTNYVMATAETGTYKDDVVVKTSKNYYAVIVDGGVTGASKTAPTTCYYLLAESNGTWNTTLTEVEGCAHSACQKPAA